VKKIALFSHDAGSSEILLELVRANLNLGEFRIFCLKDSPCYTLIKAKELELYVVVITTRDDIFEHLSSFKPSLILYGTGWQNHTEYHFLEYAKEHKLPSIAFLDHWTNYRERFGYPSEKWRENLPSFIATHDKESFDLAKSLDLPNVIAIKNYAQMREILYAKEIFSKVKEEDLLLFLTEPTAKVAQKSYGDANFWGFDEESVFRDILANKSLFCCQNILIRLHPSDSPLNYKKIDPTAVFSNKTLLEDIARAKIIIGIDTVALQSAYLLGKKVISYIPSKNRFCLVPLPKENKIQNFDNFDISSLKTATTYNELFGMDFALFLKKI
jgi:hypothetical protein